MVRYPIEICIGVDIMLCLVPGCGLGCSGFGKLRKAWQVRAIFYARSEFFIRSYYLN